MPIKSSGSILSVKLIVIVLLSCCVVSTVLLFVLNNSFKWFVLPWNLSGSSNSASQTGQPVIGKLEFRMYTSEEAKENIVTSTDVAKFGLYASKFTVAVSNGVSVYDVIVTLLDPSGKIVNDVYGNPVKFYANDDGTTIANFWPGDAVKGDGIYTIGPSKELANYDQWCSFPGGQYQYKVDVIVNPGKGLKDVSAEYPLVINKNCE